MPQPEVVNSREVASTRWLRLCTLEWRDEQGRERQWDCVERATRGAGAVADGVCIFARLLGGQGGARTVLVRQYRPPLRAFTIELPAGLVDAGETAEEAAVRELREETGYVASRVTSVSPPLNLSPGLTNEVACLVEVEVRLDAPENAEVVQDLDEGEAIETVEVELRGLGEWLRARAEEGDSVPLFLHTFALGCSLAT